MPSQRFVNSLFLPFPKYIAALYFSRNLIHTVASTFDIFNTGIPHNVGQRDNFTGKFDEATGAILIVAL